MSSGPGSTDAPRGSLLRVGETCWRAERAGRAAFLVDGEAYFRALAGAIERARSTVWLVGWDFHSGVRLLRDEEPRGAPDELIPLLEHRVRRCSSLRVYVLGWDFALLYALEREPLPLLQLGARTHRRIRFALDSSHPLGGSQHQKIAVVDDAVAFVGGLDLTAHRWDTREHAPHDPRRVTPSGAPYAPFHDLEMAVDGAAAAALGQLARLRWLRATGRRAPRAERGLDPWPEALEPDVRDVSVGIARTQPSARGRQEVREVEALYRVSIGAARRWIYVENQYLTSRRVSQWMAERLREEDGPEIVIVGPRENMGWLEQRTMGALRDRAIQELREADGHDRLRIVYPHQDALPDDELVNVHAKLMIVDDDFVRIGSSNLSGRSLGLDTECDLALEAGGRREVRQAIARLRDGLLAEHLGTTIERVEEGMRRHGSLVATLDQLSGGARTLRSIPRVDGSTSEPALEALRSIDPEHPIPLDELMQQLDDPVPTPRSWLPGALGLAAALVAMAGLAWALQRGPLQSWVAPEPIATLLRSPSLGSLGPLVAAAMIALASVVLVPVTALLFAAGLAFGPWVGGLVGAGGSLAGALLGYVAGRVLWRDTIRRLAGRRLNTVSRRLARRGVRATFLVRALPVAPFTIVSLVAGATRVRVSDFVLGTTLGMLPGGALLVLAGAGVRGVAAELERPVWLWWPLVALALAGVAPSLWRVIRASVSRRRRS